MTIISFVSTRHIYDDKIDKCFDGLFAIEMINRLITYNLLCSPTTIILYLLRIARNINSDY